MSYADIDFAIVPAAPPARKNQRATSCPAPISANVPYFVLSRLIWSAFWFVLGISRCIGAELFKNPASIRAGKKNLPEPEAEVKKSLHCPKIRASHER